MEWTCYNYLDDFFEKTFNKNNKHYVIYLDCDPEIAYSRIQLRGRQEEKNIDLEFLKEIKKYHDNWLLNSKTYEILTLNCNESFIGSDKIFETVNNFLKQIS